MNCDEIRRRIWERVADELSPDDRRRFDDHVAACPGCADETAAVVRLRGALRRPAAVDVDRAAPLVAARSRRIAGRPPRVRAALGLVAAAAIVVAFVVARPAPIEAVGFDALVSQHRICLTGGHGANHYCHTQNDFAEEVIHRLGFAPAPIDTAAYPFVKGGVCAVSATAMAHAMFTVDGVAVSYFQFVDPDGRLVDTAGIAQVAAGVYRAEADGKRILITRAAPDRWGIYVGDLPLASLVGVAARHHADGGA
jgi:hypothetical protein